MSLRNNIATLVVASALAAPWGGSAQQTPSRAGEPRSSVKVAFPADSPLTVVSADWGESRTSARGGALVLDLQTSLLLRNAGQRHVRGVILLVQAQEVTPGGKASVAAPSLDVKPGETFPIKVDLRLLLPLQAVGAAPVEVALDGVLFDDLTFYGPNRLDSRRLMTAWELEARRDRQHMKGLLAAGGAPALQRALLDSLARQAQRPVMGVQLARGGRATNLPGEREVQFSFLRFPDAPVEPLAGSARLALNEARAPQLDVRNRSGRAIRYLEIGWLLKDRFGREFLAGSVPAKVELAPGASSRILQESSLRFPDRPGQPLVIESMTGFVSHVEFADGAVWIPPRAALADPRLLGALAPSPEEQRLTELYRRKGLQTVVDELKKF